MGTIQDWLDNSDTMQQSGQRVGLQRSVQEDLNKIKDLYADPARPSSYDAVNAVYTEGTYDGSVTGGDRTITITLFNGETFTTAAIAYNASAATIESAIDTAATGVVTGWTNGDISVSGGDPTTAAVVYTFDGSSVAGGRHTLSIDGSGLTGGGSLGTVTETTPGQSVRYSWALLATLNVITAGMPDQGDNPSSLTVGEVGSSNPVVPNQQALRTIAKAAAIEDGNAQVETSILSALGLSA